MSMNCQRMNLKVCDRAVCKEGGCILNRQGNQQMIHFVPPVPPSPPMWQNQTVPVPTLTEADVRRIVREELAKEPRND